MKTYRNTGWLAAALACMAALAGPLVSRAEEHPEVRAILDGYVEALGGREALQIHGVRYCRGVFVDDRPYRGPADSAAVLVRAESGRACEIVEDGAARVDGTGRPGERSKLSWLLDPRGALTVREDFPNLRHGGEHELEGIRVMTLVSDRDPDHYALHFEAATGLLYGIGHYWRVSDWREVDGVRVPHRIDCSRKGGANIWLFDEIVHEGR
jgi:hypothetical protein